MAYVIKNWTDGNRVYAVDINRWEKGINDAHNEKLDKTTYTATDVLNKLKTVHGASSGLNADLLDGQHASYFAVATTTANALDGKLDKSTYIASDILSKVKTVDGADSGLDADLLDGKQGSEYAPASHTQAISTVTGLQTALDGKANTSHNHVWANITDPPAQATRWPSWSEVTSKPDTATRWPSWSEVTSKPSTFAPSAHTHSWSQVTGAPATATRWPSWSEVTSKPTLISYGTTVPTTLAYNTIFVKI